MCFSAICRCLTGFVSFPAASEFSAPQASEIPPVVPLGDKKNEDLKAIISKIVTDAFIRAR